MSVEEVPLRTKASPTCLGCKNQATIASDGVYDVQIRLFIVHLARSTWAVSILLYVHDLVIADAELAEIDRVKLQFAASFDMKDLGDLYYFLGIDVIHTPKGILISQRHYALSMLFTFGMVDYQSISIPLD